MTTLRERLVNIGARIVQHGRSVIFQLAEVMVSSEVLRQILTTITARRPLGPT